MLDQILFATANGLTSGMAVFLVAAGVTLIFGLLRILNFAQGSFFMLGAYVAFSIMGPSASSMWTFLGAALVAGIVVAALGMMTDVIIFRRLRRYDESYALIATFALMLLLDGTIKFGWGVNYHSISPPPQLENVVMLGPVILPIFSIFITAVGLVVFIALELAVHRLWVGKIVQALAHDQWMSGFVGINVPLMLTLTVAAAFFLAGLAGGLLLPNQTLSPTLSHAFLLQAFIAVIVGGLGNIRGAFLAALVIGLVDSLNAVVLPEQPGIAMYLVMGAFLLWRPGGLLSTAVSETFAPHRTMGGEQTDWSRFRAALVAAGTAMAVAVAAIPFWMNSGMIFLAGLALIAALFALSWNLLFGTTGLATFGHAAFFAIGSYACALMLKYTAGHYFIMVLLLAGVFGAIIAFLVGIVALRRMAGIALAILTLALGEIMRLLVSSSPRLGRDDGLAGIPRPDLELGFATVSLQSTENYFWFLFLVCGTLALALWWITAGPFGRVLRAIREDAERTSFLGIKVARFRLIAFTLSGFIATLAGALEAPWVQIVTPASAGYLVSMHPMLSTLLGGASFYWGPVVGTVLFFVLDQLTHPLAGLSEMFTGGVLLLLVMVAPDGVLGIIGRLHDGGKRASTPSRPALGLAPSEVKS